MRCHFENHRPLPRLRPARQDHAFGDMLHVQDTGEDETALLGEEGKKANRQ